MSTWQSFNDEGPWLASAKQGLPRRTADRGVGLHQAKPNHTARSPVVFHVHRHATGVDVGVSPVARGESVTEAVFSVARSPS